MSKIDTKKKRDIIKTGRNLSSSTKTPKTALRVFVIVGIFTIKNKCKKFFFAYLNSKFNTFKFWQLIKRKLMNRIKAITLISKGLYSKIIKLHK